MVFAFFTLKILNLVMIRNEVVGLEVKVSIKISLKIGGAKGGVCKAYNNTVQDQ